MVSDRDRHELYVALQERLGPEPADTMMDLLPPVGWADVARRSDIDRLDAKIDSSIESLRIELKAEMHVLFARTVYANFMMVIAMTGVVLALVKLT